MNSRGNLQRKCVKAHPKTAGKCSSRCIRWYPRLELPRDPDGARRFEALGGYPTRAQAEAALADALARRSHGFALDPSKLTVNQYLDRWLTPPPVPRTEVAALAPEQVAVLLDAAARTTSHWLGPWTVLAAATGARNGELCGLEWADLDLDTGTVQFRQALTIIDPTVLSDDADGHGGAGMGGGRKELAIGPLKSTASNAILTLPSFAVQALRRHRRQQHRLSLALGQNPHPLAALGRARPATPPGRAGPGLPHRAGHADQPQPRQPRLRPPGRQRRAGRPPAPTTPRPGVRDGSQQGASQHHRRQLRHADGGALAQRVYIHQLPQTAPRLAGVIEGVFGPEAHAGRAVSAGRRAEGKWRESQPSSPT